MAFLYKNFVFSALTRELGNNANGMDGEIGIDPSKSLDFRDLLGTDLKQQAMLVIREERAGGTVDFEIVRMRGISGNNLLVDRAQEGSEAKAFTTAARISNTVTAERASILGGVANTDLEPDADARQIGLAAKPFMDVHARNLKVRHGQDGDGEPLEFTIKPQAAESITENQDLLLPKAGGTIARLEDSIEVHPGCFAGSLCVEPVADEVADASARGHPDIGDGIYVISYRTEAGTLRLKIARHNDGEPTHRFVELLGLAAIPNDDEEAETLYRFDTADHTITVGDTMNLSFSDISLKDVGDYETAEGVLSSGFTLDLVNEWLSNIEFDRRPVGQLAAQKIYGQDVSADTVVATNIKASPNLTMPVIAVSPGVDHDTTEGYEVGSVVYSSLRKMTYVCIDASEGAAKWRPTGFVDASNLVMLVNYQTPIGPAAVDARRDYEAGVSGGLMLDSFNRFYVGYSSSYLGAAFAHVRGVRSLTNVIADYSDFMSRGISTPFGEDVRVTRVSNTRVSINYRHKAAHFDDRWRIDRGRIVLYGD